MKLKMIDTVESLDPLYLPLRGIRLIEASAGTGKTFTIAIIYLRFLLGLGGNSAFPRFLSVEDILVITFTEAATTTLRTRIYQTIHDFRIACLQHSDCISKKKENLLFERLLNEIKDKKQAAQLLQIAERKMNEAAIFTIHGFCRRMLRLYSFQSHIVCEQQVIEDEFELRYQACIDFWRRHCYPLTHDLAKEIYKNWKTPKELLLSVEHYLQGELPTIKEAPLENETLTSYHNNIIVHIIKLKKKWRESIHDIRSIIEKSDVNRRIFHDRNLEKWIEMINSWVKEEKHSHRLPNVLKRFSQSFLTKQTKSNGLVPRHFLFVEIDDFLTKFLSPSDLLFIRAITEIRKTISYEKNRRNEISFNDMLSQLDEILKKEKNEELATVIRARFPVAIIDEFQDTDPQQCRIFFRIWKKKEDSALLLIGDPKQAIYAFRGADIFTYMKARKTVEARYTLDTNWRSAPGIVTSINTLFSQMKTSFIFREIPFFLVKSANKNSTLYFEWKGKIQPSMSFWLMNGTACSTRDYQVCMAKQSAEQIRNWLSAGSKKKAILWRDNIAKPVIASDIAVLVRNGYEATLVRNALSLFSIPSIYLSDRDNIFDTIEAKEMFWLLQAVLFPEQKRALRNVLASSIFGLTTFDIDFLNNNQSNWNKLVEEFIDYRKFWKEYGVMAMTHEIIRRRKLDENILAFLDGKHRLTNILHISEILQEASLYLESQFALIQWLAKRIDGENSNMLTYQARLENDENLVQIITIHKSKGLEYPLVWLPFISHYRIRNQAFYHDRVSFEPILDLKRSEKSIELAEAERLSEDLRLLYVALTRSVWHCSLGIAPLFLRQRKEKTGTTDIHRSAIGYLVQKGEPKDSVGLRLSLENLCDENISLYTLNDPDKKY